MCSKLTLKTTDKLVTHRQFNYTPALIPIVYTPNFHTSYTKFSTKPTHP